MAHKITILRRSRNLGAANSRLRRSGPGAAQQRPAEIEYYAYKYVLMRPIAPISKPAAAGILNISGRADRCGFAASKSIFSAVNQAAGARTRETCMISGLTSLSHEFIEILTITTEIQFCHKYLKTSVLFFLLLFFIIFLRGI